MISAIMLTKHSILYMVHNTHPILSATIISFVIHYILNEKMATQGEEMKVTSKIL